MSDMQDRGGQNGGKRLTAEGAPVDLRPNRRLALLHGLEDRLFGVMKSWGIPGPGILRRLTHGLLPPPRVEGAVIVTTNVGFGLQVDPSSNPIVDREIFERGTYEPGTLSLLGQLLREGDTFVDVGANIGLMALAASGPVGAVGRVIAVEPVPGTYDVLQYNVTLNQLSNVETCLVALGSAPGSAVLYERPEVGRGGASLLKGRSSGSGHTVAIETLDALLGDLGVPGVDVLKVDVEGWEMEVLKGGAELLSRPSPPAMIIECSSLHPVATGQSADLFAFLTDLEEYRVFRQRRGKEVRSRLVELHSAQDLPAHDNLICLRDAHLERLDARTRP